MHHTERKVDDGLAGAALGGDVVDSPVETSENTRIGSLCSLEHLDGNNVGLLTLARSAQYNSACTDLLSNTIGRAGDSASNMSTVSKSISVGSRKDAISCNGAATELRVRNQNTAVNNISIGALASRSIIDVAGRAGGTVGDRSKTPGSSRLGSQGPVRQFAGLLEVELDDLIRFNEGNLVSCKQESLGLSTEAYLRAGLNFLDSLLIELSSIGVPVLDVEGTLDTSSLTLRKAAAMNIPNPLKVRLDLCTRSRGLEGDNVFSGYLL